MEVMPVITVAACVTAYLIVGIVLVGLLIRFDSRPGMDEGGMELGMLAAFWPFVLLLLFCISVPAALGWLAVLLSGKQLRKQQ